MEKADKTVTSYRQKLDNMRKLQVAGQRAKKKAGVEDKKRVALCGGGSAADQSTMSRPLKFLGC